MTNNKKKAFTLIEMLVVIVIIGIDIQNKQYLSWIIKKLKLDYNSSHVFISSFGYANTVAIYFSFL